MEQKEQKGFPIGRIVRIMDGITYGNKAGAITKILSKPGIVTDREVTIGIKNGKHKLLQLCEAISSKNNGITYNNKLCFYEHIHDMIPASIEEKKAYHKNKKSNNEKSN